MSKQVNGSNKMVQRGQRMPTWQFLIHSLDSLQGQHRVNRRQAAEDMRHGMSSKDAFSKYLQSSILTKEL